MGRRSAEECRQIAQYEKLAVSGKTYGLEEENREANARKRVKKP
jgi:hypothetical protein